MAKNIDLAECVDDYVIFLSLFKVIYVCCVSLAGHAFIESLLYKGFLWERETLIPIDFHANFLFVSFSL